MKDKKEYSPVDMLKELRENDEARYPANTAPPSQKLDRYNRNVGQPDQKGVGYIARPANVELYPDIPPDLPRIWACLEKTQRKLTTMDIILG